MRNFALQSNFDHAEQLLRAPEEISSLFNGKAKLFSNGVAAGVS